MRRPCQLSPRQRSAVTSLPVNHVFLCQVVKVYVMVVSHADSKDENMAPSPLWSPSLKPATLHN